MKSKTVKLTILGIITLGVLGWSGWQLFRTKKQDSFSQKEISIKPAELPNVNNTTYEDWSGFSFSYPDMLTVKEVELDNKAVYSSLEIAGSDGKKLTVRVADTPIAGLIDWQKNFNRQNSVRKIDQTTIADLPALKLSYGAPEMLLTVAINNGVIYQIESLSDFGFWDRTHNDLINSWTFTSAGSAAAASQNDTITLIEETVE